MRAGSVEKCGMMGERRKRGCGGEEEKKGVASHSPLSPQAPHFPKSSTPLSQMSHARLKGDLPADRDYYSLACLSSEYKAVVNRKVE